MSAGLYGFLAFNDILNAESQATNINFQSRLNREMSAMNTEFALHDAWEAERYGFTESARYQATIDETVSEQRTAMAAQGVDITSGTALQLQQQSKLVGFLNTLSIQQEARNKAKGLKMQALGMKLNSIFNTLESSMLANNTRTAGYLSAINNGITGYAEYKKEQSKLQKKEE